MAVQVVFFTPRGVGSIDAPGIGDVRIREAVSVPGETTARAEDGEAVLVFNGEADPVLVAHGYDADASATSATEATSAGVPVAAGQTSDPFVPVTGANVAVAALA